MSSDQTQRASAESSAGSGLFYYAKDGRPMGLRELTVEPAAVRSGRGGRLLTVEGRSDSARLSSLVSSAARSVFEMDVVGLTQLFGVRATSAKKVEVVPTVFEDASDGRIRLLYKELVVRFRPDTTDAVQSKVLKKFGFEIRRKNAFVAQQAIATQPKVRHAGADLVAVANRLAELEPVAFCVPHFVSEFSRNAAPPPRRAQWHLSAVGAGGKKGAWAITRGSAKIVVAVLDDGVDLLHPNLANRLARNPNPLDPKDRLGRDFFVPADKPDHYDPSPKRFRYPYDQMDGNDIHGTPCAGVVAANGRGGVYGIAPRCRILPVKIFHGDDLAEDAQVADAIRYAALCAQVLSCSWGGPVTPDLQFALQDVQSARGGRGAIVVAASGNERQARVGYPAADPHVIAVGACSDQGVRSAYSNYGPELSVVAPSNGGLRGIFTTDVSVDNRGFNTGSAAAGGVDGLFTSDFGGTSSATPLVAGIAALLLSKNPRLTRAEVKEVLEATADKIGPKPYNRNGFNREYGYGRVNAAKALRHPLV